MRGTCRTCAKKRVKYASALYGAMPYSIEQNSSGRYIVISPKGKKWKTTYPTRAAAEKAVAYVEGRFGGSGSSPRAAPLTSGPDLIDTETDTAEERRALGIPPKLTEEEEEAAEAGW